MPIPPEMSAYFAWIGAKGGIGCSEKKREANKSNLQKAREAKARKRMRPFESIEEPLTIPESLWQVVSLSSLKEGGEGVRIQQAGRRRNA